ncbi:MAG: DUF1501 domain-containing protein [Xanthomonadales bacterium PRO7]|nr:DUF1501 domain-containing protein [Xanthomonadales bacterium PRO7]
MAYDRRKFIKDTICAALGGASVYSAFGQMQLLQAAVRGNYRFAAGDYKALVCVFLYGGNDSFNMVVPYTQAAFNGFYGSGGVRPQLALNRAQMTGVTVLNAPSSGAGSPGDGNQYALNPVMGPQKISASGTGLGNLSADLASVFNAGHAAVVANTGTLVRPTTQAQYQSDSYDLPPQLFSHSDQSNYWQSSPPSNLPVTGWGGRLADMVAGVNAPGIPILLAVNGGDIYTRGQDVNAYDMGSDSATTVNFLGYNNAGNGSGLCDPAGAYDPGAVAAFCNLQAANAQANVLERAFANSMNHSIATAGIINGALSGAPAFNAHDQFPDALSTGGDLDTQLQTVAKLIWAANNNIPGYTGLSRQVFFVSTGGYDSHSDELASHGDTLPLLSRSLAGFYNALASVGLADKATAFTCSDFGRTMTSNDGGTDHGWGSHHFVVGGAVNGGKFYGNGCGFSGASAKFGLVMPSLANPNVDDSITGYSQNLNDSGDGYGRMIPTTSVEQYAATLARWFGVNDSDIATVFPSLGNFTTKYLGFV